MEYNELVKKIALQVLEQYNNDTKEVDNLIKGMERSTMAKEAPMKAEAAEKAEAKEKKEVLNPEPRINIDKMAQDNATNYLKFVKKKVSNYV